VNTEHRTQKKTHRDQKGGAQLARLAPKSQSKRRAVGRSGAEHASFSHFAFRISHFTFHIWQKWQLFGRGEIILRIIARPIGAQLAPRSPRVQSGQWASLEVFSKWKARQRQGEKREDKPKVESQKSEVEGRSFKPKGKAESGRPTLAREHPKQ